MQGHSEQNTTYQYPDPDDLDNGTSFAWAGDDDGYIPEALRKTTSSNWPALEAVYKYHDSPLLGHSHHRDHEEPETQDVEGVVGSGYAILPLGDSYGAVIEDRATGDPRVLNLESLRGANGAHSHGQLKSRHALSTTGRSPRRGSLSRGHPGIKRGLRNPVEPVPEFKVLQSHATMAFIDNDYDGAENLTLQALQINPEMYSAHSLLSEIHAARGDLDKAIVAAYSGAHTQPRNMEMWSRIARMLLDRDRGHTTATLVDAIYCYNRVISIDKSNVEARFQRAALNHELGKFKQVVTDYELLNKYLPHDTTVLRHLAQASIEINEPDRALRCYKTAITHFQDLEPFAPTSVNWSDVNVLVELYLFCQAYDEGLELTKSLSRWLLGRRNDHCWEHFTDDDREWDLNDEPRRVEIFKFIPNQYEQESYGAGLPLDLRIKLGILRLNMSNEHVDEAISHFEWLDPADSEIGAKIFDYPDLFRDVARSLMDKGLHEDAIRFYEPLRQVVDQIDESYRFELAQCYAFVGKIGEAEALSTGIREFDDDDEDDDDEYVESDSMEFENETRKRFITASDRAAKRLRTKPMKPKENLDFLLDLFNQRKSLQASPQRDQLDIKLQWNNVTQRLLQRFMQEKAFFPELRIFQSKDYAQQARHLVKRRPREKSCTTDTQLDMDSDHEATMIPGAFASISFNDWLEIFLEYGLSLASDGKLREAYQVISSATQATVFNDLSNSLFLIHVCWLTCALLNDDDETLCNVCRWFMKDCQFVTDAYRLFSAANRLCDSDNGWYNCGPSQKHILRQIKAMDFALAGDAQDRHHNQERSAYTALDADGNVILPQNMDISLLMLYGHVLYTGKNYAYANNYFLRALAVDPENSMIKLSLALGYIHHALKRQADNRHQLLMQGFAFLFEYYDRRRQECGVSEQQEAAYNVARAFHLLGLTHVATPYYEHCLALSNNVQDVYRNIVVEDLAQEAAFALQGIWATNGNENKALEITEQWLQIR